MRERAEVSRARKLRYADEQAGDVVAAAGLVGGFDEAEGCGIEFRGLRRDGEGAGDFVLADFAGEAVGAEEEEVAGLDGQLQNLFGDGGLGADGAGDDAAERRVLGLLGGDGAEADLLVDEGVVVGLAAELARAEEIAAAVAGVGDEGGAGLEKERDEGGAHTAEAGVALGAFVDGAVGRADGLVEGFARRKVFGVRGEVSHDGVDGEAAGNFAAGRAAHAVTDDEDAAIRTEAEGVFVVVAEAAVAGLGGRLGKLRGVRAHRGQFRSGNTISGDRDQETVDRKP